ncbi:MAG: 2TM domain-containing protein [Defluviitaleaceae bacterium]|nr:2TM domain-containing protein [Defluviitaleaceae bacterium]
MENKVALYNSENLKIGTTYTRRAIQLVKQQRAYWVDDNQQAIRFFEGMENADTDDDVEQKVLDAHISHLGSAKDTYLMRLAKRRVILKTIFKALVGLYFTINILLVAIWFFLTDDRHFWPGWVIAGWGFGIIIVGIVFKALMIQTSDFTSQVSKEYHNLKNRP